ncbi:uncharacterized protein SPPG_05499 [Spizellomyces punctatus DAOM BR117]|uniref:Uncharacterized protein n=1 Tax=Spizellomyces punctatus (strain DAOM BR117) TaxID=645134 RepID=A0A0L0HEQ3_SPIPD|nr:uncharacterized protein SPPG_05499 [Spizellomyces punctatus DAOM BR117]KNC99243.1 hypothetical protein SPPG_05499 [Spizellomyces punctatus DAOM BR117]|eukprot:XP_016607283.1 hypothetical protein SPPG_05499 [Spizellomyces punctatus DAOM BR117]
MFRFFKSRKAQSSKVESAQSGSTKSGPVTVIEAAVKSANPTPSIPSLQNITVQPPDSAESLKNSYKTSSLPSFTTDKSASNGLQQQPNSARREWRQRRASLMVVPPPTPAPTPPTPTSKPAPDMKQAKARPLSAIVEPSRTRTGTAGENPHHRRRRSSVIDPSTLKFPELNKSTDMTLREKPTYTRADSAVSLVSSSQSSNDDNENIALGLLSKASHFLPPALSADKQRRLSQIPAIPPAPMPPTMTPFPQLALEDDDELPLFIVQQGLTDKSGKRGLQSTTLSTNTDKPKHRRHSRTSSFHAVNVESANASVKRSRRSSMSSMSSDCVKVTVPHQNYYMPMQCSRAYGQQRTTFVDLNADIQAYAPLLAQQYGSWMGTVGMVKQ